MRSQGKFGSKSAGAAFLVAAALTLAMLAGTALADGAMPNELFRTVYAIGNTNGTPQWPLVAFAIKGNELFPAETVLVDVQNEPAEGPVTMAVDSIHNRIYTGHEHSSVFETFDSRTFEQLDSTELTEISSPTGMAVDEANNRMYVATLGSTEVFVYDTEDMSFVEQFSLADDGVTFGLALVGTTLYAGNGSNTIHYYDINSHEELGSFDITDPGIAVTAMNYPTPLVFNTMGQGDSILTKFDVDAATETTLDLGATGKGLRADPDNGFVYVLVGKPPDTTIGIDVINALTLAVENFYAMGDATWSSTDCGLGKNDFGRTVKVNITSSEGASVTPGSTMTFDLVFTNHSGQAISILPARFHFVTNLLTFVSSNPQPDNMDDNASILVWNDLAASFGGPLAADGVFTVQVTFTVNSNPSCTQDVLATVIAQMVGATYADETIAPDTAGNAGFTSVCVPADDDADDTADDTVSDDDAADDAGDDDDDSSSSGCCG